MLQMTTLESFKIWCWRRVVRIERTDKIKNKVVLKSEKKERRRKANWIGHITKRNSPLRNKRIIEGNDKLGRGWFHLLDDLKGKRS